MQAQQLLRNATFASLPAAVRVAHDAGMPPSEIAELTGWEYATIAAILGEVTRPGPDQLPF